MQELKELIKQYDKGKRWLYETELCLLRCSFDIKGGVISREYLTCELPSNLDLLIDYIKESQKQDYKQAAQFAIDRIKKRLREALMTDMIFLQTGKVSYPQIYKQFDIIYGPDPIKTDKTHKKEKIKRYDYTQNKNAAEDD